MTTSSANWRQTGVVCIALKFPCVCVCVCVCACVCVFTVSTENTSNAPCESCSKRHFVGRANEKTAVFLIRLSETNHLMLLAPCEHGTQLFPVIHSGLAVWQRAGDNPGCYFYELHPNKSHFQKDSNVYLILLIWFQVCPAWHSAERITPPRPNGLRLVQYQTDNPVSLQPNQPLTDFSLHQHL